MTKFEKALKLANFTSKILKIFNFEATSFPGKIVSRYYPDFLSKSAEFISGPKFAITGTNGKTTTSTLLAEIFRTANLNIVNNKLGANMPNGIVTALSNALYSNKRLQGAVIECDEAYFSYVSNKFPFDYLLITNLFRDQLDRYGEMDIARKKIIKGIELNPNMKVVLNADDPTLFEIAEKVNYNKNQFIYFGVEDIEYKEYEETSKSPSEALFCPKCGSVIEYDKRYYAQIGKWHCKCGVKRQTPDILAKITVYPDKNVLNVTYKGKPHKYEVKLTGLYNAYNVLGAITCALVENIPPNVIELGLDFYKPVFGRHQKVKLNNGGTLTIHLIKNPVGASEVLRGLKNLQNSKMLIAINDNYADGRDVSWLWDADFEALKDFQNIIYTTGIRSYDMALRLKHALFDTNLIETFDPTPKVSKSIECAILNLNKDENLTVLTTYTGLLEINANLNNIIKEYGE